MKMQPEAIGHKPQAAHPRLALGRPVACGLKPVACIALLALRMFASAQDIHFSQFHLAPLTLNPALAGAIGDDHRFTATYRDQWSSIDVPFTTYAASYDLPLMRGKMNGRYLGVGAHAYQDKAGTSGFGTLNAGASIAYDLKLSRFGDIAFGLQGAYGQRSADLSGLSWDSQYTGSNFDPALPTGEAAFVQRRTYVDLAAGILWRHIIAGSEMAFGAAVHHPHQPDVSLLEAGSDPLPMRISVHGEAEFETGEWLWTPRFLFHKQGGAMEATFGAMAERRLGVSSRFTDARTENSFQFGCLYRWQDAIIPMMLFDYHRFLSIGVSYDVNISRLQAQTSYQGGLEVALVYHGAFSDQRRKIRSSTPQQK